MLKTLKETGKIKEILILGLISLLCFGLSAFRFFYTDTRVFLFLNWNLFLACIPWILSTLAVARPAFQKNKIALIVLLCAWLLFFPNAPYILTDLFHLRFGSAMPAWFDLVLILSFAWTGLMFGFQSLQNIERLSGKYLRSSFVPIISSALLFLGSFGIYVGRYLRWNSWDVIRQPMELMYDIGDRFVNPLAHPRTWGMTILMGVFLNMVYWSLKIMRESNKKYHESATIENPEMLLNKNLKNHLYEKE